MDRCLVQPVKVQALLDVTEANNQVARSLLAQNNPVLVKDKQEALAALASVLAEDRQQALEALAEPHARAMQAREAAHARAAILELCDVLAIEVTTERQARMVAMTGEELDALRSTIRTERRWPEERGIRHAE